MSECPPDASVVIPSYNNKISLLACLERLGKQSYPAERYEVVVVLDGSTDGSDEVLRELRTPFRLTVVTQENKGRAAALNHGARIAAGKILIITDNDILVNPEFVQAHVESHKTADIVIGPIPLSERSPVNFLTDDVRIWADRHDANMRSGAKKITGTDIYGANISMPKVIFQELGGYREDLRRTEDYQIGIRIVAAGYRIHYCPNAIAEQIYDKTIREWCSDFYVDGKSQVALVQEFPDEIPNLPLGRFRTDTLAKRILRPMIIKGDVTGDLLVGVAISLLELCRRLGLRWRVLGAAKGFIGNALYWKGVFDSIDDEKRFNEFIQGLETGRSEPRRGSDKSQ